MAAKTITLRLVAYSDAAGKFDADAPLNGNEDNFFVDDDLSDDISGPTRMDTPVPLSAAGCLMAVADGMGGQNAGEVASEIAVDTIAELFRRERLTPEITATAASRAEYIKQVIVEADRRVKAGVEGHPEREGMGSTIIISWIFGGELSVGWLGDSRAYRFNPVTGLMPVSKDHTYVQELADKGIITYEDTFGHPQGNIVTRSLGDPDTIPAPESVTARLAAGDIIMMCSDGLSGVVPDRPLRDITDSIEGIMTACYDNLSQMRAALMDAAKRQHWYDNVTVLLCRVDGDLPPARRPKQPKQKGAAAAGRNKNVIIGLVTLILIVAAIAICIKFLTGDDPAPRFTASPDDPATEITTEIVEAQEIAPEPPQPAEKTVPTTTPPAATGQSRQPAAQSLRPNISDTSTRQEQTGRPAPPDMEAAVVAANNWKNTLVRDLVSLKGQAARWEPAIDDLVGEINSAPADIDSQTKEGFKQRVQSLKSRLPLYLQLSELATRTNDSKLKERIAKVQAAMPGHNLQWVKKEIEKIEESIRKNP